MLTKPQQGQQFKLMRAMVMKCPVDYNKADLTNETRRKMMMSQHKFKTLSQECVELDQKCCQ